MGRGRKECQRKGRKEKEKEGKIWERRREVKELNLEEQEKRHQGSVTGVEGEPRSPSSQRSKEENNNVIASILKC